VPYPVQNDVRNRFDLSGIRDFQIDPEEVGERDGRFNGLPESRPIAVPGSWNEQYEDIFNYLGLVRKAGPRSAALAERTSLRPCWFGELLRERLR
jgi:hypothetical protein